MKEGTQRKTLIYSKIYVPKHIACFFTSSHAGRSGDRWHLTFSREESQFPFFFTMREISGDEAQPKEQSPSTLPRHQPRRHKDPLLSLG